MSIEICSRIIRTFIEHGKTLVTAESCTGGGIAAALTDIPGSSAVLWGAYVTYTNRSKMEMLDVSPLLLERFGAVSSGVVKAMAWNARERSGADWAVAVTGIAGPDGGTPDNPVGSVWIAWSGPDLEVTCRHFHLKGSRTEIRHQTLLAAMTGLLDRLT